LGVGEFCAKPVHVPRCPATHGTPFIVGILVQGFLIMTLVRYRARPEGEKTDAPVEAVEPSGKSGEGASVHLPEHGNNKVEAGLFFITTFVFLSIAAASYVALFEIETPNPQADNMVVRITGHQWAWEFHYPVENVTEFGSLSEAHFPVNKVVKLEVTSSDVIHAIWIPNLGVKIDAVPGRINHFWFQAQHEGRYLLECAEFCQGAHSTMHAVVVVESQATYDTWIAAKRAAATPPPKPVVIEGGVVNISLDEWRILPARLDIAMGANVSFNITNEGTINHSFFIGVPYNVSVPPLIPGAKAQLNVTFNKSVTNGSYWCDEPGHRALGMNGTLNVSAQARVIDLTLKEFTIKIEPATVVLHAGERIIFRVHNNGTASHNIQLGAPYGFVHTPISPPGSVEDTPAFTVDETTVVYWCDVPGHRQLGMEGAVQIQGGGPQTPPPPAETVPGFDAALAAPALGAALALAFLVRSHRKK